jgi:hypothetical protein
MFEERGMPLDVRVLYTESCGNTPQTIRRVQDVAQELGIAIEISKVLVTSQDQANELRFLGSPSVQIEGQDIDPDARAASSFGFT